MHFSAINSPDNSAGDSRRLYYILIGTNLFIYFGYGFWWTLLNNFAVEELGLSAFFVGLTQSVREVPGLLGFTLGLLALMFSEMRIVMLSLVSLGAGIALTAYSETIWGLATATIIFSFGFHYFISASRSLAINNFEPKRASKILARFSSIQAFATLLASGVIYVLVGMYGYRALFFGAGAIVAIVGLFGVVSREGADKPIRVANPYRAIRRSYLLYYLLIFFDGCRRHMFVTFAVFLLVKEFHASAKAIAALFFINNALTAIVNWSVMGKIINRFGERKVLVANYFILIFIFLGYIAVRDIRLLYGLYLMDGIIYGASVAVITYLQKIAPPEDITSNVAFGQTLNHVAAVTIPLAGGIIWDVYDYRFTFFIGLILVVVSLFISKKISPQTQPPAKPCVSSVSGMSPHEKA